MDPHMDPAAWAFAFNLVRLLGGLSLLLAAGAGAYGLWVWASRTRPQPLEGPALLDEPRPLAKPKPRETIDA